MNYPDSHRPYDPDAVATPTNTPANAPHRWPRLRRLGPWALLSLSILGLLTMLGGAKPVAEAITGTANQTDCVIPYWTKSYQLYKQPHALWLSEYERVGQNLPGLKQALEVAEAQKRRPELVVYGIPYRDMGQSSAGGFDTYAQYFAENDLNAKVIKAYVAKTGMKPRIYLEPDALGHAIQYRRDRSHDAVSEELYRLRTTAMQRLIDLYHDAGALVYLDAAHSDWFDYGDDAVTDMANTLKAAGVGKADGLAVNISNRQTANGGPNATSNRTEAHYLAQLLPKLNAGRTKPLDVVMDTSRNGGRTATRHYWLADNGDLVDNETAAGRWVGHWETMTSPKGNDIKVKPFFGKPMQVSILTGMDKFQFDSQKRILTAPKWLDPVGDVKLGPAPTDNPGVAGINRFRYIKPPDDCDGALNCPARVDKWSNSQSKHDIWAATAAKQKGRPYTDTTLWPRLLQGLTPNALDGNPNA